MLLSKIGAGLLLSTAVYAHVTVTPFGAVDHSAMTPPLLIAQQSTGSEQSSQEKAETARAAYKDEDSKPVENWFGCPPAKESKDDSTAVTTAAADSGDVDKSEPADENCDPDAPQNDSPQKN
jgi:hypothetical protein